MVVAYRIQEGNLDTNIRAMFVRAYGNRFTNMDMTVIRTLYSEIYEGFRSSLDDVFDNDDFVA